jgi:hypothetical protein
MFIYKQAEVVKMKCRNLVFISILAIVLVLAGCARTECRKNEQCTKPHFTGSCTDKKCVYEPIPNECGNSLCERATGENPCTCSEDCGTCTGKSGKYLVKQCTASNECVEDIPITEQKPITQTRELSVSGSKISVTTTFAQPFNTRKDQVELEFSLNTLVQNVQDLAITRLELTGITPDKRTVLLADKSLNKQLRGEGSKIKEWLILDFPTADKDGELNALTLKITADYSLTSAGASTPKTLTLNHPYQSLKFLWARPEKPSGCPANCDDGNPGTEDFCGPETGYFCEYKPVIGACGNSICDTTENTCTCPADCGPCAGSTAYLTKSCEGTNCVARLKQGITVQPQSLFDDRDLGVFHLQNNYKFAKPFNIKSDILSLDFVLYQKQDTVTEVTIKDVRLLEGAQEVAYASANKKLSSLGQKETVSVNIPSLPQPEQEKSLVLRVWYEYVQNSQTLQGDYTKPLGKIPLVNPDA